METALRESELRWRALFNCGSDAVFIHSILPEGRPGKFLAVNDLACSSLGYTREELLEMTPGDIDGEMSKGPSPEAKLRMVLDNSWTWEAEMRTCEEHTFPVEISGQHAQLDGQSVVVAMVRDISQRRRDEAEKKKLENRLQQAAKMESLGQLAGGIAHDFNNLLTVMNGYSEMLLEEKTEMDPMWEPLTQIKTAGEQAAALTRQLLTMSRQQITVPISVDLNQIVRETVPMLRRMIGEDIQILTSLSDAASLVKADPGQIHQALINLTANARDAMPDGGRLRIETAPMDLTSIFQATHPDAKQGQYILLTVTDTGTGMTPEVHEHIFEPFFTTKPVGKGTGLGLFDCAWNYQADGGLGLRL